MLKKGTISFDLVCLLVAVCFLGSMILIAAGPDGAGSFASNEANIALAASQGLPTPSKLITTSSIHSNPVLKGIKINPSDPFKLEFIIDTEDNKDITEAELSILIKYFLAALTIPEKDLWVNLSPYEKDRILPDSLSLTDLGKDLLGQDYLLKQLSSSLMYPDSPVGKKYWDKTYKELYKLYNTTKLPINTFNKTWIVPDKAQVYENGTTAIITEATLKVLSQEDYLAMDKQEELSVGARSPRPLQNDTNKISQAKAINKISQAALKETVIPELTFDVNNGENFAKLRQMYHSLILATWFKKKLKDSIYQYYIDQGKVEGIDLENPDAKEKIYNLYVESFKKGVYDYIKVDPAYNGVGKPVKRRYHSGGFSSSGLTESLNIKYSSRGVRGKYLTSLLFIALIVLAPGLSSGKTGYVPRMNPYEDVVEPEGDPRETQGRNQGLNKNGYYNDGPVESMDKGPSKKGESSRIRQKGKKRKYPGEKTFHSPEQLSKTLERTQGRNRINVKNAVGLMQRAFYFVDHSVSDYGGVKAKVFVRTYRNEAGIEKKVIILSGKPHKREMQETFRKYFLHKKGIVKQDIREGIFDPENYQFIKEYWMGEGNEDKSLMARVVKYFQSKVKYFTRSQGSENDGKGRVVSAIEQAVAKGATRIIIIINSENLKELNRELEDTLGQRILKNKTKKGSIPASSSIVEEQSLFAADDLLSKGGIDLDPTELDINISSSAIGFDLPVEAIEQFQAAPGLTFRILEMQRGVDIGDVIDIKEDKALSYLDQ